MSRLTRKTASSDGSVIASTAYHKASSSVVFAARTQRRHLAVCCSTYAYPAVTKQLNDDECGNHYTSRQKYSCPGATNEKTCSETTTTAFRDRVSVLSENHQQRHIVYCCVQRALTSGLARSQTVLQWLSSARHFLSNFSIWLN